MTNEQLYYLVGILEGEGCFYIRKTKVWRIKTKAYKILSLPVIQLKMTDKDIVEKTALIAGCRKVCNASISGSSRKPAYVWALTGSKAIELMKLVQPLMGNRRSNKIIEILTIIRGLPCPTI